MRRIVTFAVIAGLAGCLVSSALAKKVRKLPESAYVKSAKIEIISGDLERYKMAVVMLDSLFLHYGPHAEALYLMSQIMVDRIEASPGPVSKTPHVEQMVAYIDSLHMCCDNKDIKKKYKKDCKKFTQQADSILVKYWREFYNAGIEQLDEMRGLSQDIQGESDSSIIAYLQSGLEATFDSCRTNMQLAIVIDPTDHRSYVAVATAYERMQDYESSIEWKRKGLEQTSDSTQLLLSIGYNYINMDKYCEAIPYLRSYVDITPEDTSNMYNLTICYNNCGLYDSAMVFYDRILQLDPQNTDVLCAVGRYYNEKGRQAADSARQQEQDGNGTAAAEWQARKDEAFDSSLVYFRSAYEANPDDPFVADMYALISALKGDFEEALIGYTRMTELRPDNPDNWTYLGDINLSLKQFNESIAAYEKAVELQPSNSDIWQQLVDLYHEIGETAKEAEAQTRLDELKK